MPTVTRSRTIDAGREEVWDVVSDPHHLPRWWPGVVRVEEATPAAWTEVMTSPRGKTLRADFTRVASRPPERLAWRQEVEASPFERILSEAVTEVSLRQAADGVTLVELRIRQRPRGLARLGSLLIRRASRRTLDEALEALERATAGPD